MKELRAEAARTTKPSESNVERPAGTVPAERPTRIATLKPDVVAQEKREWTKADVEVLRSDLLLFGIEATNDAIFGAWERHSDSHAAGWLSLYGNADDDVRALLQHLDIVGLSNFEG